jgi:PhnB protein
MNSRKARGRTETRSTDWRKCDGNRLPTLRVLRRQLSGRVHRYKEILGGDLVLLTLADAPSDEPVPPEQADLIIHAALTTDGAYVMGSDDPTGEFTGIQGMSVSVSVDDADEARRVFDALADGGQVTAPLTETFFSPAFGMCVDRFGLPWMIVAASPDTQ